MGNGARRNRGPWPVALGSVIIAERQPSLPGRTNRATASSVSELNRGHGAHVLEEIGDATIAANVIIGVDSGAIVSPPPTCLDGGFLRANDAGAADRELPEVDEMPVGQVPAN